MEDMKTGMKTDASLPADSQQPRMSNGGRFGRFVLHFQNVAGRRGQKTRLMLKLIFNSSRIVSQSR